MQRVTTRLLLSTQSAAVAGVRSRGGAPREIGNYELGLKYSSKLDGDDSKKGVAMTELDVAKTETNNSDSRRAMSLADRCDIFRSLDESDAPSPRRSHSVESD